MSGQSKLNNQEVCCVKRGEKWKSVWWRHAFLKEVLCSWVWQSRQNPWKRTMASSFCYLQAWLSVGPWLPAHPTPPVITDMTYFQKCVVWVRRVKRVVMSEWTCNQNVQNVQQFQTSYQGEKKHSMKRKLSGWKMENERFNEKRTHSGMNLKPEKWE